MGVVGTLVGGELCWPELEEWQEGESGCRSSLNRGVDRTW